MYLKKNILTIIIIFLLFLFGSLLLFIDASKVITIIMYIIAGFMILLAISFLVSAKSYLGKDKGMLIAQSIVLLTLSVLIFIFPDSLMRTVIGVLFILVPLFKLITVQNKFEQFLKDIYKYIIGFILIFSFDSVLDIAIKTLGILLFILGIILLYLLIINRKRNVNVLYKLIAKKMFKI